MQKTGNVDTATHAADTIALHRQIAELEQMLATARATEQELRQVQAEQARQIRDITRERDDIEQKFQQEYAAHEAAQETLRNQGDLLGLVIQHTPNAIAVYDRNLHYIAVSDRYLTDYNIVGQNVIGRHHYEVFPEIPQRWREVHQRCLAGAIENSEDDSFVREDGSITYNRWDCRPWRDAEGNISGIITFTEVITERKLAEQQLRMAQFSLDQAIDGIQWIGRDGQILYVNDARCAMLGYTRAELLTMKAYDVDPNLSAESWSELWSRLKQAGSMTLETVQHRKDDTMFPAEITTNFLDFNGMEYIFTFVRDITERKQAEEQIKASESLLRETQKIARIGGWEVDLITEAFFWTEEVYHIHEVDLDFQPSMENASTFYPPESAALLTQAINTSIAEDIPFDLELQFVTAKGNNIDVRVLGQLVREDGRPVKISGIFQDITERKRAEEERLALQEAVITAQQAALRELSTPLIPLTDNVVVMPLIGSMDSARAQQVISTLLDGVATHRATTAILDITGVPVVDTQVANTMLRAAQAVKLLGAQVILTGIRPEVAQTLVGMGADLSGMTTRGSLQSGIASVLK